MGFFDKLKKQECSFCGKEAGVINRKKLHDGNYICKECEKKVSAFYDVGKFNKDDVLDHMEYMKRINKIYEQEFEVLSKDEKRKIMHRGFWGIVFADSIGMFEVINPHTSKKDYKELFRYDQIRDYKIYTVENSDEDKKKGRYKEVGLTIYLDCAIDLMNAGSTDAQKKLMHPYASEIKMPFDEDCEHTANASYVKQHLDEVFGKPSSSALGSMKQKFTGTGHKRQEYKAMGSALGALGSLAKGKMKGEDVDVKSTFEGAINDFADYITEGRTKYREVADSIEIKVLGKTLRDF